MDTAKKSDLLTRAQSGDIDAFAELFEELRPKVFAVACRLVGPDDADDVATETFLKAWKALPRFDGRSKLMTWLYRITSNCALDYLRKRKRRAERILPEDHADGRTIADLEDEGARSASEEIVAHEEKSLVRQALDQLDEPHRIVLLLRFHDNMSYSDIAAATKTRMGTVMSRIFNAKRKLKKIIDELEQTPAG